MKRTLQIFGVSLIFTTTLGIGLSFAGHLAMNNLRQTWLVPTPQGQTYETLAQVRSAEQPPQITVAALPSARSRQTQPQAKAERDQPATSSTEPAPSVKPTLAESAESSIPTSQAQAALLPIGAGQPCPANSFTLTDSPNQVCTATTPLGAGVKQPQVDAVHP